MKLGEPRDSGRLRRWRTRIEVGKLRPNYVVERNGHFRVETVDRPEAYLIGDGSKLTLSVPNVIDSGEGHFIDSGPAAWQPVSYGVQVYATE